LVGPSGGGKSSLADLLLGLYEPTSGSIKIDGHDILNLDTASWRNRIGVVSQDTILFNATVRENIAFARPDATFQQIQAAAEASQAANFIKDLPQGYDTLVGERGFMLSGGQRQRLAIARALIRQPDLLILDEATSALDTNSEIAVQQTIDNLSRSVTRLVVAHRLSTVRAVDKIIVVEQGRLAESGSHEELVALGGIYAKMWDSQTRKRENAD
jgi:ABC-type multidrug transport system fused ATPase/permease subunit